MLLGTSEFGERGFGDEGESAGGAAGGEELDVQLRGLRDVDASEVLGAASEDFVRGDDED